MRRFLFTPGCASAALRQSVRPSGRGARTLVALASTLIACLAMTAGSAQAVVVLNAQSQPVGVDVVPGTGSALVTAGVPVVTSSGTCQDPSLPVDFGGIGTTGGPLPSGALCWHGGTVLPQYETFAISWDPLHRHWQQTSNYLEQFMRDVADGSGTLTSPFAVSTQYTDNQGNRAQNKSVYGGACIDNGNPGGFDCTFQNSTNNPIGEGNNYPASPSCTASTPSDTCLTDADIQSEVSWLYGQAQVGQHTNGAYKPLLVVMLPQNVEVCTDSSAKLCSVNSSATAKFCSYHNDLTVGGVQIPYVVLPWVIYTGCDETGLPALPTNPTPAQLEGDAGSRLVGPLSEGMLDADVNPWLNGWYAHNGSEIADNSYVSSGCAPAGAQVDTVQVGNDSYVLPREFNNAYLLDGDPFTYGGCAPVVDLAPSFVVPSPIDATDEVQFDGSVSTSTLLIPQADYHWSFGDGTSAIGTSVVHAFAAAGSYTVTLTVTDRGGNQASYSQTVGVLTVDGQPAPVPATGGGSGGSGGSGSGSGTPTTPTTTTPPPTTTPSTTVPTVTPPPSVPPLTVHVQLKPGSLPHILAAGLVLDVFSNRAAAGVITVSIGSRAAKLAHISAGRARTVVIGRGTVARIVKGKTYLHLHLSAKVVRELRMLRSVNITVRLTIMPSGLTIDAAGPYGRPH